MALTKKRGPLSGKKKPEAAVPVRIVEGGTVVTVSSFRAARLLKQGAASLPADTTRAELDAIEAAMARRLENEIAPLRRDGLLVDEDGAAAIPSARSLKEIWRWLTKG